MTLCKGIGKMKIIINGWNNAISFILVIITVALSFFSLIDSSFGTKALLVALVLLVLNLSNTYLNCVLPSMLFCFFAVFLLIISGQLGMRGFNAPINHGMKFVYIFLAFSIAVVTKGFSDSQKRIIIIVTILSGIISGCISIYSAVRMDPYAIRYASERGFSNVVDFNQLYGLTLYAVSMSLFLIAYGLKKHISVLIATIVMSLCVYFSLFSTAILLLLMGIVIGVLVNSYRKEKRNIIYLCFFVLIFILVIMLFSNQISEFIYNLTDGLNWIVRDRIRSVVDSFLGTDHGINYSYDRRNELAGYSINSFLQNPLFGVGYDTYGYGVIGCHQEWQDMLGVFGLIGTSIVLLVFFHMIKFIWNATENSVDRTAFIVSLILFFALGFVNPCLSIPVLIVVFVLSPNISALISIKRKNDWSVN